MWRNKKTGALLPAYKILSAVVILSTLFFTGCTPKDTTKTENTAANTSPTAVGATTVPKVEVTVVYDAEDTDVSTSSSDTIIKLNGTSITVDGKGATASGSALTISAGGTYQISGTLSDGQILVNTTSKTTVRLILNGVNITCSDSAPIYILDAKKAVIVLVDGSKNSITDGTKYTLTDLVAAEPNAALFSKCDLTITGNGSLTIDANYNNGITGKDDLKITGGTLFVTAVSDGIKGRDVVAIKNASITVDAKEDGIQASNDTDVALGFALIENSTLIIDAGRDAIQAEKSALINGGTLTINFTNKALPSATP